MLPAAEIFPQRAARTGSRSFSGPITLDDRARKINPVMDRPQLQKPQVGSANLNRINQALQLHLSISKWAGWQLQIRSRIIRREALPNALAFGSNNCLHMLRILS